MIEKLVLGVGNLLYSDDALGIVAIRRLQAKYRFPDGVALIEGGTSGMDLLCHFEGLRELWIIDAIHVGSSPGAFIRLEGEQIRPVIAQKVSRHQDSVSDLLAAATLLEILPAKVVLMGLVPEKIEFGFGLSPKVALQMKHLVRCIAREVQATTIDHHFNRFPRSKWNPVRKHDSSGIYRNGFGRRNELSHQP